MPINSSLKAFKSKLSRKNANNPVVNEEQEIQIQLPNNTKIDIGNMVENLEGKMIVDPANAETMDGKGGVSGAIKAYFKGIGKLDLYENDIHKIEAKNGFVCPNGEVRFTSTAGIDIVHTSVPDLRKKENQTNGKATDDAKQKMFNAYYHAFEFAHLHQTDETKALDCPLLGAGIFKWPPQESAALAGRALQAFRTAYGDKLQINIRSRKADFNKEFTQQDMVTAILNGMELQANEPVRPSGTANFDFNDSFGMRKHFSTVSIETLLQHYNEYVAAGNEVTKLDSLFIDMLKMGFNKISRSDRAINPRLDPWTALALLRTLKTECNKEIEKWLTTTAFGELCNDYLDKVANLIDAGVLNRYGRNKEYIAQLYNGLGMPDFPEFNPTAPLLTLRNENLEYLQPAIPLAPLMTQSEVDFQQAPQVPSEKPLVHRLRALQYSQLLPQPGIIPDLPESGNLQYPMLFPEDGFIPENTEPKGNDYPDLVPYFSAFKDVLPPLAPRDENALIAEKYSAPKHS
ncbi:MAG: macro domain-containing protein [Candidatus Berkiella sp.]